MANVDAKAQRLIAKLLLLGGTAFLISGCAVYAASDYDRMLGRPPIGQATRVFAAPTFAPPPYAKALGVFLFARPPATAQDRKRYERICVAWVNSLPDAIDVSNNFPGSPQMITVWPRDDVTTVKPLGWTASEAEKARECRKAVANYPYAKASRWIASLPAGAQIGAMDAGPLLIAWSPPAGRSDPRSRVLTFNLSNFNEPGTLRKAFALWGREIEAKPDRWSNGWDWDRVRIGLAAVADLYGQKLIDALKVVNPTG